MEKDKQLNLKALILVGGFGTRLRPLTFSKPKPLVELCNKPTLSYQIEALVKVGVNEIVLAINYQPEKMNDYIKEISEKHKIKIVCCKEETPLGTAGPIGLARDTYFKDQKLDYLFVFNADIVCKYDLESLLNFHISKGAEGTICVTPVTDPSKYGVILSDENQMIVDFIEKPSIYISNTINAGLYVFTATDFLKRIETKPSSIEREIFPKMAKDKVLYSLNLVGYWADIGQPKDFLTGTMLLLNNGNFNRNNKEGIIQPVLIEEGSTIDFDGGTVIGPNVVIGKNVKIGKGTKIKNSVIMAGTNIGNSCLIEGSIIGWYSKIGNWVRIKGLSLLGEDVTVSDEVLVDQTTILPNVVVKTDTKKDSIIMC